MKDFFGLEIFVGDVVAYQDRVRYGNTPQMGVVMKFTAKQVTIRPVEMILAQARGQSLTSFYPLPPHELSKPADQIFLRHAGDTSTDLDKIVVEFCQVQAIKDMVAA